MVSTSQRVFIGGLAPGITQDEICSRFFKFGRVTKFEFKEKPAPSGDTKVFAFATVEALAQDIEKCLSTFNQTKWKGRTITLQLAKENFLDRLKKEREKIDQVKEPELSPKKKAHEAKTKFKVDDQITLTNPTEFRKRSLEEDDSESSEDEYTPKNLKKFKGLRSIARLEPMDTQALESDLMNLSTKASSTSNKKSKSSKASKKSNNEKESSLKESHSPTMELKEEKPMFLSLLEQPLDSGMEDEDGEEDTMLEDEEMTESYLHDTKDEKMIEEHEDPRFQFVNNFVNEKHKKGKEEDEALRGPCFKPLKRYEPPGGAAPPKQKVPEPSETSPLKKKPAFIASQKWDAPKDEPFRFTSFNAASSLPDFEPLKFPKEEEELLSSEEDEEEDPLDFSKQFPKAEPESYKPFFFSPKQLKDENNIFKTGVPNKEKPHFHELFKKVRRGYQKKKDRQQFRRRGRAH